MKAVYTIVERGEGKKAYWLRIGTAWVHRDQSLNVKLDAMPVSAVGHACTGRPSHRSALGGAKRPAAPKADTTTDKETTMTIDEKVALWLSTRRRPRYIPCCKNDIPAGVRFDTQNPGEIVRTAYGGFGAAEHGEGDPFMRVIDSGEGGGAPEYFRLA